MVRAILAAALAALTLLAAACGESAAQAGDRPDTVTSDEGSGLDGSSAGGMCAPETPDCVDTVVTDGGDAGMDDPAADLDVEGELAEARALLGLAEEDLPADVRVGKRGGEHMMLTEDYVFGRHTVELDTGADGVARVTSVTTELEDGPETITAE